MADAIFRGYLNIDSEAPKITNNRTNGLPMPVTTNEQGITSE